MHAAGHAQVRPYAACKRHATPVTPRQRRAVTAELFHIYDPSRKYLEDYTNTLNKLVAEGKVVPSPVTEFKGLEGAKAGLQKLLDGKTSAEKCVVTM